MERASDTTRAIDPTTPGTAESARRIHTLPPLLVNQIAAGEVVERPSSVVKELVENALDAGATRIVVELEEGGVELVAVTDDGEGMTGGDLRASVEPHTTSKISRAEDLDRIGTFGFRGEALASIASVSRVSIRSRRRGEGGAWILDCEGDRVEPVRPASGPEGTRASVRNLFFNTPARRKFLRTPATEQSRCTDVVRDLAMAHPGIGFTLVIDGREAWSLSPGQGPRARAVGLLGRELEGELLEVRADALDDARGLSLWGLAGLPSLARGSARAQHLFVNGRVVRDRTMQHAVSEAYRGLIEPGRYPTVVLMVEMPAGAVDVNVHPQKAEVRFRDQSMVHSAVLGAVREALRRADLTPRAGLGGRGSFPGPPGSGAIGSVEILPQRGGMGGGYTGTNPGHAGGSARAFADYFARGDARPVERLDYQAIRDAIERVERAGVALGDDPAPGESVPRGESPSGERTLMPLPTPARRLLQVHKSYLVTQDERGVLIVDQHALHERVMFEMLLARVASGTLESQRLLVPALVEAGAERVARLAELSPLLTKIGISADAMGPATVGVHEFATFLFERGVDPVEFMEELFEKSEREGFVPGSEAALRDVLDMMACKAAVKAGDRMSEGELAALMTLREEVERSSNCPHGRPTTLRITIEELEKLFGRR